MELATLVLAADGLKTKFKFHTEAEIEEILKVHKVTKEEDK